MVLQAYITSFLVRPTPLPKDGWVDLAKPISTKGGPKSSTSYLGQTSLGEEAGDLGPKEASFFLFFLEPDRQHYYLQTTIGPSKQGLIICMPLLKYIVDGMPLLEHSSGLTNLFNLNPVIS